MPVKTTAISKICPTKRRAEMSGKAKLNWGFIGGVGFCLVFYAALITVIAAICIAKFAAPY